MNVYYLPARTQNAAPEIPLTASRWSVFQARAHRAWWRFKLTMSEVYTVIRRGGGRNPLENHIWFADEEPLAPRRRALGPARILDFDAARRRRTLASASV